MRAASTAATINDGNLQTCWSPGGETLNGKSDGYDYIMIDLETQYMIEAVIARSRRDMDQPGSRVGWVVQLSDNAEFNDYVTIGSKTSEGSFGSDLIIENISSENPYRYIRVASKGAIVVAELEVYGRKFDPSVVPDFSDVVGTKDEIPANVVRELGIMKGISRTVFGKNMTVTRAEACEIAAKLANLQLFGDISSWFIQEAAGLKPNPNVDDIRCFEISPHFINELDYAKASYDSVFGRASVEWHRNGEEIRLEVSMPKDTYGNVVLPKGYCFENGGSCEKLKDGTKTMFKLKDETK